MANNKDWGFRDQIQRAAVSIMNNIAEGYESGSDAKYANFLNIAKGSCSEVRNMLYLCKDRHFCTEEQFIDLKSQAILISSQLYKLIEPTLISTINDYAQLLFFYFSTSRTGRMAHPVILRHAVNTPPEPSPNPTAHML